MGQGEPPELVIGGTPAVPGLGETPELEAGGTAAPPGLAAAGAFPDVGEPGLDAGKMPALPGTGETPGLEVVDAPELDGGENGSDEGETPGLEAELPVEGKAPAPSVEGGYGAFQPLPGTGETPGLGP